MALFGLKNKNKKKAEDKAENVSNLRENTSSGTSGSDVAFVRAKNAGAGNYGVLLRALITEKSSGAGEDRTYVFAVAGGAGKHSVKSAVEAKYGVAVEGVRILNTPDKIRRRGRQVGIKAGFKKAMVKVKEGQVIEIQ